MKIRQGWNTEIPGYLAEMLLIDTQEDDGTWVINLVQSWRVKDRGTAEILAAAIRLEAENTKEAQGLRWRTCPPADLAQMNDAL